VRATDVLAPHRQVLFHDGSLGTAPAVPPMPVSPSAVNGGHTWDVGVLDELDSIHGLRKGRCS
jgi:hypothetical protein